MHQIRVDLYISTHMRMYTSSITSACEVKPATKEQRCAFAELFRGAVASWTVSHAWAQSFSDVLAMLEAHSELRMATPSYWISGLDLRLWLYMDLRSVCASAA